MAVIKNWHIGGIADSKRQGLKNSAYKIFNADIHSDPGVIKCHPELVEDGNSSMLKSPIIAVVPASNNKTYYFGSGGGVWVRNSSAVYSKLGDIPAGSNYGTIFDAKEFNGVILYTMQRRVGRYVPGDSWNTATTDGTQNNFKNIDVDLFHPIMVIENDAFVGHTNKIGKITPADAATVGGGDITDAIALDSVYTVESFGEIGRNLIIGARAQGTTEDSFAGFSKVFNWNLVSNTWSTEREVKELGISCFFLFDGILLFNAGKEGNLYSYDGENVRRFKRIPGIIGNEALIYKNATSAYKGLTMLGISDESGSPESGIVTLGGYDKKYPDVFNLPIYMKDREIFVLTRINSDLIVCYKASTGIVKKIGTTLGTMILESMIYDAAEVRTPIVNYSDYPSGTAIVLEVSINSGSYAWMKLDASTENKLTGHAITNARTIQFRLRLTPSGTKTPVVESVEI